MSRIQDKILLVGSVHSKWTAEQVFTVTASALGDGTRMLPDGEIGDRFFWINYLGQCIYNGHPDLEILHKPSIDFHGFPLPKDYMDNWKFRVKPGAKLRFDNLGYAGPAKDSYAAFRKLRDAGIVAKGTKFQVSMPLTESGVRMFVTTDEDFRLMAEAYREAMYREIADMLTAIPAEDLVIQWDICGEVAALEDVAWGPLRPAGDPLQRYADSIAEMAPAVPKSVVMGYHICYGDLQHKHFRDPRDLEICVDMANAGVKRAGRPVDFIHVPVPIDRHDDAYFAPLGKLEAGDAKLFIGLVHWHDGLEGTLRRGETAKKYRKNFGITTECGLARRPVETLVPLLHIHREAAEKLGI